MQGGEEGVLGARAGSMVEAGEARGAQAQRAVSPAVGVVGAEEGEGLARHSHLVPSRTAPHQVEGSHTKRVGARERRLVGRKIRRRPRLETPQVEGRDSPAGEGETLWETTWLTAPRRGMTLTVRPPGAAH